MNLLLTLPLWLTALLVFTNPLAAEPPAESPLTDSDVVTLVGLHLGNDVLIAKINQAAAVNFDLSTEALSKLKNSGVDSSVIAAMLERSTPAAQGAALSLEVNEARSRAAIAMAMGQGVVTLHTKDGDIGLSGRPGEYEFKYFVYVAMNFMNYPGAASKFRTTDRRPSLLARVDKDPNDKQESSVSYLVKLDASKRKDQRSLKIGQAFRTGAGSGAPDDDWILPYDSSRDSPGLWRITPRKDLVPGEYGLYVGSRLYDFGVDK